jgi:hypothetical protein
MLLTVAIVRKLDTRRRTCDWQVGKLLAHSSNSQLSTLIHISKAITISAIRLPVSATHRAASNVIKVAQRRDDLWMGFSAYWNASWGFRSTRTVSITFGWPRPSNHSGQEIWIRCRQQKISWSNSFFPLSSINSLSSFFFSLLWSRFRKLTKVSNQVPAICTISLLRSVEKKRAFSCVELTFLRLKCVRFSYFPGFSYFFSKNGNDGRNTASKKGQARYILSVC